MANCNNSFKEFNKLIKLNDQDRDMLIKNRDILRARIVSNYRVQKTGDKHELEIEFQTQGSFIMDTIINPKSGDFDLDDGVYFNGEQNRIDRKSPDFFHSLIRNAVNLDLEYERIIDKDTCIRIFFKQGFHIDIPIYYAKGLKSPDLAHKEKGWTLSDPVEFIEWFETLAKSSFEKGFIYESKLYSDRYEKWLDDIRKKDSQLRRIVRYLKAWCDDKKDDMPCGIEITILVGLNYEMNERDDISLNMTLKKIQQFLISNGLQCPRPTTPKGEDLFMYKTKEEKDYFMNSLDSFISSSDKALGMNMEIDACNEWSRHLGSRFLCKEVIRVAPSLDSLKSTITQKPWSSKN